MEKLGAQGDFDEILDNVIKNPEEHLDKAEENGQNIENNKDIGIGTDKEVVNLNLWKYYKNDDGKTMSLGDQENSTYLKGYIGDIVNGEIIGKIPQYIYIYEEKTIYEVTSLKGTFAGLEIVNLPEIPETITDLNATFMGCRRLKNVNMPENIQIIGFATFDRCESIENLYIPNENVKCLGSIVFAEWNETQTINFECDQPKGNEWGWNWKGDCNAKINWGVSK